MAKMNGKQSEVSVESLTDQDAIFRAVRNKCIQSPFTVIPLALAGGLLLLSLSFGLGFPGFFASFLLAVTGAAAFVYHIWIRGEALTREHIRSMMEQLKNNRHRALEEVAAMCRQIGFAEGAKEATELSDAYSQYTTFLETRAGAKLGSAVSQRLALAESARKAGVEHLRHAAEIHTALQGVDIETLRTEREDWMKQLEGQPANAGILKSKVTAHTRQIDRYDQLALKRDQLVASSNELEAALMNAFMSEAGRTSLTLDKTGDNPATRLLNVVAAAESAESDLKEFLGNVERETVITP